MENKRKVDLEIDLNKGSKSYDIKDVNIKKEHKEIKVDIDTLTMIQIKAMLQTLLNLEAKRIAKDENKKIDVVIKEIENNVSSFIEKNFQ